MRSVIWRHFDFWLFGAVVLLAMFGIAMIRSAIAGSPGLLTLVPRQIVFVGIGLVLTIVISIVDYHYWKSIVTPLYVVTLVMLIVLFVIGKAKFGAARWIETGLVDIQPAELAKIVVILTLADFFARTRDDPHDLRWIITSLVLTLGLVIWILLQPNLSNTIVIMVLWFALIWISGLKTKYIVSFLIAVVVIVPLAFPFLAPYQQGRIVSFFISDDNSASSYGDKFNVNQALITVGSGGWFGMGYGHGTQVQLRFLKVRQSDFIFSAMAEEFGFVGTVIVMLLLVFVILRCVRTARLASDPFGGLIAFGFATLIFFQTAVNIGVNLQVIPVTGLTLPFISYGGSSLVSLFLGIGLVESVVLRQKPLDF
jgi:rod shape determining protein RodA